MGSPRISVILALGAVLASASVLGACQSTKRNFDATTANVGRGAAGVRDGLGDAVTAPLEDLNLKRKHIPDILNQAREDPYDLSGLQRCEAIAAEVGKLDAALGPDLDEPPPPARTRGQQVADGASEATLGVVRDTTTDVIPMRGWVRRLTGAQRHSKLVQDSIRAGMMRRSYLKGTGMQMNCNPPAAPSWFRPTGNGRQLSRGASTRRPVGSRVRVETQGSRR